MSDRWMPDTRVGLNAALAGVLQDAANDQGLSPEALGAKCVSAGHTVRRIFHLERGISVGRLEDISQGLGIPVEELLDRAYQRLADKAVERAPWYSQPRWDGVKESGSDGESDRSEGSGDVKQKSGGLGNG